MFQVAWADYSKDNLVVQTKDGSESSFSLATRPVMKFNGGEMIIKASGEEAKFGLNDVEKLLFAGGTDIKKGDVNGDGTVDVSDVNILIDIILGNDDAGKYEGRADVSGDGVVDVADVNALIDLILNY